MYRSGATMTTWPLPMTGRTLPGEKSTCDLPLFHFTCARQLASGAFSVSPPGILKGPAFAARVAEICRVLPAPQPLPGLKYRRILMPGMVGGEVQFALLSFIAHALRLRGAEVTGLLCDRLLPACTMQKSDHHELACDRWCYRNSGPFVRAAQLPHRWYSEFITPDERTECDRLAARVPVAELKRFEWRGIALGVHVDRSVQSHFKVGAFELDRPDMVAKARQLLAAGMYLVRIGERVFEELRIDKVFMDDGQKIDWGVIRSVARARGVPVDLTLGTCRGGCRLVEHDQSTKWSDPLPWWPQWRDVPLTPDQEAELDAYFAGRATRPYGDRAWTELTRGTDRNEVRRRIGLPATPSGLVFAMFPNLGYDAAVTTDEPTYATGAEWVVATVRYFARRPEQHLVIKLHPEDGLELHLAAVTGSAQCETLSPVSLDLDFGKAFAHDRVGAYERLLLDAIAGRLNLFVRSEEQEEAWRWVEPILRAWERENEASNGPLPYDAGSSGPAAANALVAREGFAWDGEGSGRTNDDGPSLRL